MDYFTYWNRLDYLLELIQKGHLSSPKDLEGRFECSERTIRKMINDLRRRGHTIRYSRQHAKYVVE